MTTLKQIEANRRNSRRSTGPRTRTGKAESKLNAMKHGLLAADLVVRGEDPVAFVSVLEDLFDEYQPQGPSEEQLVERVAACTWRLRRVYRIEAGVFTYESLKIELDRAEDDRSGYEEVYFAGLPETQITDEKRHCRATARVEKTARLLEEDSLTLGVAFQRDANYRGAISKLSRYEAAIERSLYRALHELQRIQASRENGQQPPSIAVDITMDGLGSAPNRKD